jgi:hypothetical protein
MHVTKDLVMMDSERGAHLLIEPRFTSLLLWKKLQNIKPLPAVIINYQHLPSKKQKLLIISVTEQHNI